MMRSKVLIPILVVIVLLAAGAVYWVLSKNRTMDTGRPIEVDRAQPQTLPYRATRLSEAPKNAIHYEKAVLIERPDER